MFLQDIIEAIEKIQQYTKGMSYEAYTNNPVVIDATILNIITLGEAAKKIPRGQNLKR